MTRSALVVDDATTIRMYHRDILEGAGFAVAEAVNGYEGLELALEHRFDVMLVDVNMPRMDGFAMVAAVRRDGANRTTPVVMVSTEDAQGDVAQGYAAGANLYLGKPVRGEELLALITVLTQGRTP
jgi:two-component system, chemotaxis family, chemotaxis protein CheY